MSIGALYFSSEPCDLTAFNDQLGMSVWGKGGRKKITSKEYLDIVKVGTRRSNNHFRTDSTLYMEFLFAQLDQH